MNIPSFNCKPDCHGCCGLVPFTASERDRVAVIRPLEQFEPFIDGSWLPTATLETMTCPFLGADGCSIYDDRPIVCRLFGSVDHPNMKCPMGCAPKRMLTDAQSRQMIKEAA